MLKFGMEDLSCSKDIWTEDDFELMGWHDSNLYSVAFFPEQYEIAFDIDYIFKWIHPPEGQKYFEFLVSPCTLVFENLCDLNMNLGDICAPLEILDITREVPRRPRNADYIDRDTEWRWTIDLTFGDITFYSVGFKQYTRREPVRLTSQCLTLEQRGGISFVRGRDPEP